MEAPGDTEERTGRSARVGVGVRPDVGDRAPVASSSADTVKLDGATFHRFLKNHICVTFDLFEEILTGRSSLPFLSEHSFVTEG